MTATEGEAEANRYLETMTTEQFTGTQAFNLGFVGVSVDITTAGTKLIGGDITELQKLRTAGDLANVQHPKAYGVEKLVGSVANTASNIKQTETGTPKTVDPVGDVPAQQTVTGTSAEKSASGFKYEHNPSENPKVLQDAIEDPNAVYGYSPNQESSRIGEYADKIDWTDPEQVAVVRQVREAYHNENESMLKELYNQGLTTEEAATKIVEERNISRINSYIRNGDFEGLEILKRSNINTYGNEYGMSIEQALEKYGSYEEIINVSVRGNAGMDACTGLYDIYHGGK